MCINWNMVWHALSAIGTIAAVIVALWLAIRESKKREQERTREARTALFKEIYKYYPQISQELLPSATLTEMHKTLTFVDIDFHDVEAVENEKHKLVEIYNKFHNRHPALLQQFPSLNELNEQYVQQLDILLQTMKDSLGYRSRKRRWWHRFGTAGG